MIALADGWRVVVKAVDTEECDAMNCQVLHTLLVDMEKAV
jgi:hypothetical protein